MLAVQTESLAREFKGGVKAVRGVDLAIEEGEIYGFLGPNGAGKTTTVRMLVTLLRPSSGRAIVAGFDVAKEPDAVRRRIGVALQEAALDPLMNGRELVELQAKLHGFRNKEATLRAQDLIERVGLTDAQERRVGTYSGGMKRRLDLAMALVHEPKVLFLDEPTTGLDPASRIALWDEVRRLENEGTTVFLTTQYLEEADELADRVGIISDGSIVAEGTPAALKAETGPPRLQICLEHADSCAQARELLTEFGRVDGSSNKDHKEEDGCRLEVQFASGAAGLAGVVRKLDEHGVGVRSLEILQPSLDDVFLAKTGKHLEGETA